MNLLERVPYFQSEDLNDDVHILGLDFNKKGLYKPAPKIAVGGAKSEQSFHVPVEYMDDPADFNEAIKITFTDILSDGVLTDLEILVQVFNEDETVAYSKTEIQPVYNIEEFMIKRYKRSYTYLRNAAKGTPVETLVNAILAHYKEPVSTWLLGNPQEFINAINNEPVQIPDPNNPGSAIPNPMIGYLGTVVWPPDGKTMKDSLIEQLTATPFVPS